MTLAHFTLTELPGTLSIRVAGVPLGAALFTRDLHLRRLPLGLIAAIAATSMLGRELGWPEPVQIGLDIAFLGLAAASVAWLVHHPHHVEA